MTTFSSTCKMIALFAFLAASVNTLTAQTRFGLKAGFNLADVEAEPDPDPDTKMLPTFQLGVIADIQVSKYMTIQPGLLLSGKGFRYKFDFLGEDITATSNPFYFQIPVNLMFQNNQVYFGAGPYVGLGIIGNSKAKGGGESVSEDLSFGNSNDDNYGPLDFGLNLEAGVKLSGSFRLGLGYGLGFANVLPEYYRAPDSSVRHRVLQINLVYMLRDKENTKS